MSFIVQAIGTAIPWIQIFLIGWLIWTILKALGKHGIKAAGSIAGKIGKGKSGGKSGGGLFGGKKDDPLAPDKAQDKFDRKKKKKDKKENKGIKKEGKNTAQIKELEDHEKKILAKQEHLDKIRLHKERTAYQKLEDLEKLLNELHADAVQIETFKERVKKLPVNAQGRNYKATYDRLVQHYMALIKSIDALIKSIIPDLAKEKRTLVKEVRLEKRDRKLWKREREESKKLVGRFQGNGNSSRTKKWAEKAGKIREYEQINSQLNELQNLSNTEWRVNRKELGILNTEEAQVEEEIKAMKEVESYIKEGEKNGLTSKQLNALLGRLR